VTVSGVLAGPGQTRTTSPRDSEGAGWAWLGVAVSVAIGLIGVTASGRSFVWEWVPQLGLQVSLAIDAFARLLLVMIGAVGTAVFGFSIIYLQRKTGAVRFVTVMIVFALSMAGLVASADVFTLFVFWEATTFTSYLLIGHHHQTGAARSAARQAALVTGAGGLAMLAGLIVLTGEAGASSITGLVGAAPKSPVGWGLVLLGAMTKSAQFPFHGWLPAAMAAPTPASAFLHSATMVKAGIVLVGRLAPGAVDVSWWAPVVIGIGLLTMAVGGVYALRQHDMKLVLAHGTVSALGAMFALIGSGLPELVAGGIALLIAHALYKSALFLAVGAVESGEKTRDLRKLTGLWRRRPGLFAAASLAAASMAGLPLSLGFATKEAALEGMLITATSLALVFATLAVFTAAYSVRFIVGGFGGSDTGGPRSVLGGLAVMPLALALVGLILGLLPSLLTEPVSSAVLGLVGEVYAPKVAVWPGLVDAFWLSLVGLVVGTFVGLWSLRRPGVETAGRSHSFDRLVEAAVRGAGRLTGLIQNGSLPVYLGQILVVAIVVPIPALVRLGVLPVPEPGGLVEWTAVAFLVVASLSLLRANRRMAAVLLLGAVGYSMSALFALGGAPDVAMTQVLVETLVVTLFALALRLLPTKFAVKQRVVVWKAVVAVAAGVFAIAVMLAASSVVPESRVSEEQVAIAVPEANGANVVNVTLVDFRALDTLGEIAVLGIAALGVMALIRPFGDVVRRQAFRLRESPILRRGAGIISPLIIVFALYLLFAGHNQPGGGFAAGLVASGWLVIVWLTSGAQGVRRALRLHPSFVIGLGLLVAVLAGFGGYVWGEAFLASAAWSFDAGPFGSVKLVTPLLFDAGVAITVLGSVAAAVRGLEAA
jgi:multicomponent Na+:H+ antiporter subunit A